MKKLITLISASALALGMGTALGASSDGLTTQDTQQATAKQAPSYLFVVSAGKAKIKKSKTKGDYVLAMDLPKINQVIMFSDRPDRGRDCPGGNPDRFPAQPVDGQGAEGV